MQFQTVSKVLLIGTVVLITLSRPAFSQTASDSSPKDTSKRDDVSSLKQQISDLEDALRRAGGPPGWARP